MKYRSIKNLRATDAELLPAHPSELDPTYPPLGGKEDFRAWCANEATDHAFISAYEGVLPGQRVTGWDGSNPPAIMHGLVVDFDGEYDVEALMKGPVAKHGPGASTPWILPTWYCRTFSGGARLIWEFSRPVPATSEEFLRGVGTKDAGFIGELQRRLRIDKYKTLAEIDKCSYEPQQYYEVATNWQKIGSPVTGDVLTGAVMDAARKMASAGDEVDIPLEDIAAQVESRWPGRWKGEFKPGARGPLFWLDDGIARDGCVVGDHGMVVFSTRSDKAFIPWGDLFGWDFVRSYKEKRIEAAVSGIWWNAETGKYYRRVGESWLAYNKEDTVEALVLRGLSEKKGRDKKSAVSEVREALCFVRENYVCAAAAPLHYLKSDHIEVEGRVMLNTSRAKLTPPAGGKPDPAKFPWLYRWFQEFFDDRPMIWRKSHPRDHFLLWLKNFYESARDNQEGCDAGMAVLIVGKSNTAKSFFSQKVLPMIMAGPRAETGNVTDWFQNKDSFNEELFEKTIWTLDDPPSLKRAAEHLEFSERIKRVVAGSTARCRGMYKSAANIPWRGRIVLTANMDADFVSALPHLDISTRDKIMCFMVNENYHPNLGRNHETNRAMLEQEIPHFLDWLTAWTPPPEVVDPDPRFGGVIPYHHPEILSRMAAESTDQQFRELLDIYRSVWIETHPKEKQPWEGTATELAQEMAQYVDRGLMSDFKAIRIGRIMHKLWRDPEMAGQIFGITDCRLVNGRSTFTILREPMR